MDHFLEFVTRAYFKMSSTWPSCPILTASLIHRVVRSDSRPTGKPRRHEQRRGVFLLSHVYDGSLLSAATM